MCELLSGWIRAKTKALYVATDIAVFDLRSHSAVQQHREWNSTEVANWREFEWTGESEDTLEVRTGPGDAPELRNSLKAAIVAAWPKRSDAMLACAAVVPPAVTTLDLSGATLPAGLVLPPAVTTLDLRNTTLPAGLVLPPAVTTLDLSGATLPAGLVLPPAVTTLYLSGATLPAGLVLPKNARIYR